VTVATRDGQLPTALRRKRRFPVTLTGLTYQYVMQIRVPSLLATAVLAACGGSSASPDGPLAPDADPGDASSPDALEGAVTISVLRNPAFPDELFTPALVAYQDGDGPWTLAPGSNGRYVAPVVGPRYGVAVACDAAAPPPVVLYRFATVGEAAVQRFDCNQPPVDAVRINGQILGTGGTRAYRYVAGANLGDTAGDVAYSAMVHRGQADLIAALKGIGTTPGRSLRIPDLVLDADRTVAIDFAASTPNVRVPVTVTNRLGETLLTRSRLRVVLDNGEPARYSLYSSYSQNNSPTGGGWPWIETLASSLLRPGDLVEQTASAAIPSTASRYAYVWQASPASVTLDLPDAFAAVPPDFSVDPSHPRLEFPTDGSSLGYLAYTGFLISAGPTVELDWSSGWIGDSAVVVTAVPDLRGLAGWTSAFDIPAYGGAAWWLDRYTATSRQPADGVRATEATRYGIDGPRCGDAVVQGPEACDDGFESETCDADCTPAVCGDGYRNRTLEECDPPDGVTCNASCLQIPNAQSAEPRDQRQRDDLDHRVRSGVELDAVVGGDEPIGPSRRRDERW